MNPRYALVECGHEFEHGLDDGPRRLDEVLTHYVENHGLLEA
jgi:hypothetical protein